VAWIAVLALGWSVAAIAMTASGRYGAGAFCLGLAAFFWFMAWFISPWHRSTPEQAARSADRMNSFFYHLHFYWAVNPEWMDRTGHARRR
jgi:hypothetical protein